MADANQQINDVEDEDLKNLVDVIADPNNEQVDN